MRGYQDWIENKLFQALTFNFLRLLSQRRKYCIFFSNICAAVTRKSNKTLKFIGT